MAVPQVVPDWWHSPELDKLDRRTRKTREAMYLALKGLLEEKPLNTISVTELTRRADINRSTFYLHFTDIYDMYEHMRRDFQSGLETVVAERADELVRGEVRPLLRDVYDYFAIHREMFGMVFGGSGVNACPDDVAAIVRDAWLRVICPDGANERWQSRYVIDFVTRGAISMAQSWIENDCRESVDDMVDLTERLINDVRNAEAPI